MGQRVWVITGLLFCSVALGANAQQRAISQFDAALTAKADRSGVVSGTQSFWMEGGAFQLTGSLRNGLGVTVDISGLHTANTGAGVPLGLLTYTAGPRYTWSHRKIQVFGEALLGDAHGFGSTFPAYGAPGTSANSLAIRIDGGLEIHLKHQLFLRPLQAGWLRTQLPNAASNVQNSIEIASGFALHFR